MKGFRDTTKTITGHNFAKGGHTLQPHFGRMSRPPELTNGDDKIGGLTAHMHDVQKGQARNRALPATQQLKESGGRSDLMDSYAKGGKSGRHFHVHKHYYSGGKVKTVSKSYLKKMEMQAEKEHRGVHNDGAATGGTINKVRKGGRMRKATGGTINCRATGGTINKLAKGGKHIQKDTSVIAPDYSAGGALYARGGRGR